MALSRGIRIHQYLDDWLIRAQSPEESSHNTKVVVDLTESLGWMINQVKSELIPTQVFSFVGYKYHLNSALVKPIQERWQKLQALTLRITNQSALTARHLMSLIGLLASTEKMVPEGRLHMRPFQWHLKENWTFPQSLDKLLPWTDIAHLDWCQNPQNVLKGADLHPQEHNVQVFTDASNVGWGAHLNQGSIKGLVRSRKIIADKSFRTKDSVLGPKTLQASMPKSNSPGCHGQRNDSSLHQQTGRDSLSRDVRPSMENHELVSSVQNISTCQTHSGCLNVIADSLSRSTQIQSTEWSLHPQVFKRICTKWFTPQVDLFATRLNHKLPLYVSPLPDQNAWNIDALNISWSSLVAYAYPPTALLPKVIQKVYQYNCLLILIAPGWPGMPWYWDLVHLSVEIPLQLQCLHLQIYSSSQATRCFTTICNTSTSMLGV